LSKNIIRVEKNKNYSVVTNTVLRDTKISWKAKGIMAYMLSNPDDWTYYLDELVKHSTEGKASFRSGFKELQDRGYVKRVKRRKNDGTFKWETIVFEQPHTVFPQVDNPHVEKPHVEKPSMDNRKLLSTEELSTNELSTEELNTDVNENVVEIVNYLNSVTGKSYRHTTRKTKRLINARFNEGFSVDDFKKVIDTKNNEWGTNPKMSKYLRPETLFGTKFESYLNQDTNSSSSQYDNLF